MTSVQERLQLKRVPLDKWSIREQLCLASAVACSGDQNWMSVSRSLKMMCGTNRPSDWFSQKSCAAQYGKLLENAETPKRKKRTDKDVSSSWNTVETPGESILRKLTQERMAELNRLIEVNFWNICIFLYLNVFVLQEEQLEYARIKEDTITVKATSDEAKLREMWQQINAEEKQREKETAQHDQWLKEREERKLELERAWRPATHLFQSSAPNSPAQSPRPISKSNSEDMDIEEIKPSGTSPLLSSLLKSPATSSAGQTAPSTTPVTSTRDAAPTITNLLTGAKPSGSAAELPDTKESFPLMHHSLTGPPREHNLPNPLPVQSPSQAAPTLSMLLENKTKDTSLPKNPPKPSQPTPEVVEETAVKSSIGSPLKDEEQQLMEVFNTLIPDNIDVLADILDDNDAIILNPELLDEAEDSILESVESLMADQAGLDMDTDDYNQSIANPVAIVAESISTAELVEQLTSTSGFPIGPTSTVKGDAKPSVPSVDDDQVIVLDDEPLANLEAPIATPTVNAVSKDDDQSDLSNDAPLSELLKDKSNAEKNDSNHEEDDDDEPVEDASSKERADVFESDSNDDKCLEIIKREIHELTGLKEIESSDNSNEGGTKPDDEDVASVKDEDDDSKMITVIPVKDESMDGEEIVEDVKDDDAESEEKAGDLESIVVDEIKSESTAEDEIPQEKSRKLSTNSTDTETPFEDAHEELPVETSSKLAEQSITIDDTDDESVIEIITEDKHLRAKRDYTRRKVDIEKRAEDNPLNNSLPDDSTTTKSTLSTRMRLKDRDRSESPYVDDTDADSTHSRSKRRYSSTPVLDSMPNSPASSTDDNREYRAWKKSIQLVLNRLTMHKYANNYLRPNDDPSYREVVLRPMDLQTLKRNVESGLVRTTVEFQRDVMLMCSNAIIFNSSSNQRPKIRQLEADALQTIDTIMETWRKEYEKPIPNTASSMPVGVASISSPAATTPIASGSTPTTASSTKQQPVRGRKSHRVSAVNQQ